IKCDFVVVTEKMPQINCKFVIVDNARRAYSKISQNFFDNPINGMKLVAVVGTNGKTSTAHYISWLLSFAGLSTGLIGTEGHYICGEKVGESLTTPDPFEFNELLSKMRAKGVDVVVTELSAHAIYLDKICGIKSDISVLTNISQDHLDYFKTFEEYRNVKLGYFNKENTDKVVTNIDDKSGKYLAEQCEKIGLPCVSYGLQNPADCFAIDVREDFDGVRFVANLCDDIVDVRSALYGEFNVYNLLAALAVCHELGIDADILSRGASKVRAVKGRFSILKCDKGAIIIDFAHTPDGLKNLLLTARTITKSRIITVFGCGGDRDKSKRKIMGEVASQYSDYVVVTSDNPRFENAEYIIEQIEAGVSCEHKSIVERTDAIRFAIEQMLEGDTVVVAGKGNENYLDIKGKKTPYNDFDVVARFRSAR
ncbi:MAG: UDP-N-acetylmuramoyl-L-alanyl-D-glutamate--2,6-diaminopimelate ligase, partial [Clostridia bacterium]